MSIFKNNKLLVKIYRKAINKVFINWFKFPTQEKLVMQLDDLIQQTKNPIVIFPNPGTPWGYMFQRPQQLAKEFSESGYIVLYCVNTDYPFPPDWQVRGLHKLQKNLYLLNDGSKFEVIKKINYRKIFWQYWPHQNEYIKKVINPNDILIYDAIDHSSTFLQYDKIYEDLEHSIYKSDFLFTSAKKIYDDMRKYEKPITLIPNGVKATDFNVDISSYSNKTFNKVKRIKSNFQKLVGYYGAIAEWLDLDTVYNAALHQPDTAFVLIGPKYPDIDIRIVKNIYYFDMVEYSEIVYVVQLFDIAMLPFKLNEITMNTSPVKIYEYMAARKVIVSTRLPEIKEISTILFSIDADGFLSNLRKAFELMENKNFLDEQYKLVERHTWENRVKEIISHIKDL